MSGFLSVVVVFVGGGLGSLLRFGLAKWALTNGREALWGTLASNLLACLLLGFLLAQLDFSRLDLSRPELRLFLGVGLCGGFSTFSTFSLEALSLFQSGRPTMALAYVLGSATLGIAAVALGAGLASGGLGAQTN